MVFVLASGLRARQSDVMRTSFRTKIFIGSVVAAAVSLAGPGGRAVVAGSRAAAQRARASAHRRSAADRRSPLAGHRASRALRSTRSRSPRPAGLEPHHARRRGRTCGRRFHARPADTLGRRSRTTHRARRSSRARERGIGTSQRYSTTVDTDMLYVAVRASHPGRALRAPGPCR